MSGVLEGRAAIVTGAGLVGLTKAAARELGHTGIRVNAIRPGLIRTAKETT